ncbi:MAG: aminodeoxychorismate/anthranilate synthase component II [Ignavibacteriae bacterium]|nr:aminodeoxychorismate/anthranilate synthase component II [Ignavibacteriota bacterium]
MRILLIDNYDSFTHNLVHLFRRAGAEVVVRRNDEVDDTFVEGSLPDLLALSPGPGTPRDAGVSAALVGKFAGRLPIFGVCLGMQVINEVFGGSTIHAPCPVHGKTDSITHEAQGVFSDIPSPFTAARYHSLCIGDLGEGLRITARASDGVAMALEHTSLAINAVQFHPESFMTAHGDMLASNVLRLAHLAASRGKI